MSYHQAREENHGSELAQRVMACPKLTDMTPWEQVNWVVKNKQCARVPGALLDLTSAGFILQVHKMLSSKNQKKLEEMTSIRLMISIVYAVLEQRGKGT